MKTKPTLPPGIVLDLEKGSRLAADSLAFRVGALQAGEPYLTPVHNFEVDGFHTYYVGDSGVWVHNANCDTKAQAIEQAMIDAEFVPRKVELESSCFAGDTGIIVEKRTGHDHKNGSNNDIINIEDIWVGFAYSAGISNWDDFDEHPEVSAEEAGVDCKVLSRDVRTGEMAYKRILKVFNHGFRNVSTIYFKYGPKYLAAWRGVSSPHPIYRCNG
ncbi:MAG: HINT domain-containing protein [Candidatus Accumulibacter sp.]|nr:HINT domain-containing protein [Accumulibacter sp.]